MRLFALLALLLVLVSASLTQIPIGGGSSGGGSGGPTLSVSNLPVVVSLSSAVVVGPTSTSVVLTPPASITDGNSLIAGVAVSGANSETFTPPAGWTQIGSTVTSVANGKVQLGVFCKTASSESGSYTFSWNNSTPTGAIGQIVNASGSSCTIASNGTQAANASTISIGGVTNSVTGMLNVVFGALPLSAGYVGIVTPGNATVQAVNGNSLSVFTYPWAQGTTPTVKLNATNNTGASAVTNDFAGLELLLIGTSSSQNLLTQNIPFLLKGGSIAGSLNVDGLIYANLGFVLPQGQCLYGYQVTQGQLANTAPECLLQINGSGNIVMDPQKLSSYFVVGGGLGGHTGPNILSASGGFWGVSDDASQDMPIIRGDTSNNVIIGNDNVSAGNQENDLILAVQTGKTFHFKVNTADVGQIDTAGLHMGNNNRVFVTSNFTTTSLTLATITGLSWTLPATARNYSYHCNLTYSQATAAAANAFGVQAATTAPTNFYTQGLVYTSLSASITGVLPTLTTTTATNVVTFTPSAFGAIGTVADMFAAQLWGTLEQAAGATTVNIMALTGNASDALTIYRGSYCELEL